jgi:hypothetical protein
VLRLTLKAATVAFLSAVMLPCCCCCCCVRGPIALARFSSTSNLDVPTAELALSDMALTSVPI